MKKVIIAIVVLTAFLATASLAFAEGKVGFVDFGKVLQLTDKGQAISKNLQATKEDLEIKIQEKELQLRKLGEELKTKKDVMAPEVFDQKRNELQQLYMQSQQFVQESNMKFEEMRIKQIRALVSDMEDVVATVSKEFGFTLVIMKFEDAITSSSIILYGDASVDLTDKAIKLLNSK
jgi:outer membrane protein